MHALWYLLISSFNSKFSYRSVHIGTVYNKVPEGGYTSVYTLVGCLFLYLLSGVHMLLSDVIQ